MQIYIYIFIYILVYVFGEVRLLLFAAGPLVKLECHFPGRRAIYLKLKCYFSWLPPLAKGNLSGPTGCGLTGSCSDHAPIRSAARVLAYPGKSGGWSGVHSALFWLHNRPQRCATVRSATAVRRLSSACGQCPKLRVE